MTEIIKAEDLAEYYSRIPREFGFHSKCKMTLVGDLSGKRVLDVDCRRGKGVVKLSDRVGQDGTAVGVDPSSEWIEVALDYMEASWRKNGLSRNNMEFRVGYPENLAVAGLRDGEFDFVFANSSLNLAFDPHAAFAEIYRVLRPGGVLLLDGVVAESERDPQVVEAARSLGNSIQSAPSRDSLAELVCGVGFEAPEYHEEEPIAPDTGYKDGETFPIVETDEAVAFTKTTALMVKPIASRG